MRLIDADVLKYALGCSDEAMRFDAMIDEMPTINPSPDWTPCADGLPEKNEAVLAIIKYAEEDSWYTYALVIRNEQDGSFDMFWGSNEWDKEAYKVIAWQPLPDPYNPDQFREPTKMMQEERQ